MSVTPFVAPTAHFKLKPRPNTLQASSTHTLGQGLYFFPGTATSHVAQCIVIVSPSPSPSSLFPRRQRVAVALVRVILAQHQRASPEAKDVHPDHDEERRSEAIKTPAVDVSPEACLQTVGVGLVPDRTVLIPRFPLDDVGDRPDRTPVEALTPPPGVDVGVDVRTRYVEQCTNSSPTKQRSRSRGNGNSECRRDGSAWV